MVEETNNLQHASIDSERRKELDAFQDKIDYHFNHIEWLNEALTHSSRRSEVATVHFNQRLEFLGDAVLNYVISKALFEDLPKAQEGALTDRRKSCVDKNALFRVGKVIGIAGYLDIGNSVKHGGGVSKRMIYDATESLIGAIFVDGGLEEADRFIKCWFYNTDIS